MDWYFWLWAYIIAGVVVASWSQFREGDDFVTVGDLAASIFFWPLMVLVLIYARFRK